MRKAIRLTVTAALTAVLMCATAMPAYAGQGRGRPDSVDPGAGRPEIPKDTRWLTPEGYDECPEEAGVTGDGSNNLSFVSFKDGDIVVAIQSLSVGHAGVWDARYAGSVYSACVWSAVKSSPGCVLREAPIKYRTYDRAYGLWVPRVVYSLRQAARSFCAAQSGEKYDISSSKTNLGLWYCSKLVWAGYKYRAGVDLDANGGYWVTPVDLYNDGDTSCFAIGN